MISPSMNANSLLIVYTCQVNEMCLIHLFYEFLSNIYYMIGTTPGVEVITLKKMKSLFSCYSFSDGGKTVTIKNIR